MKIYANGRVYFENGSSINRRPIDYHPRDGRSYWLVEIQINNQHLYERRFEKEEEAKAFIDGFISASNISKLN